MGRDEVAVIRSRPREEPAPLSSPSPTQPAGSRPIGLILLSLVAAVLWVLLLGNTTFSAGGGEDSLAQALKMLFIAGGLWIVLAIMLFVGGIMGSMPRWVAWLAVVLVPMAAIADTVAIDMCSRHMEWAIVLVAVLPALVAFYAFWARLPGCRRRCRPSAPASPCGARSSSCRSSPSLWQRTERDAAFRRSPGRGFSPPAGLGSPA